jgi:hypothetical protein
MRSCTWDVDLQREATIATKEEISPTLAEEKHMPSHSNDDIHYM